MPSRFVCAAVACVALLATAILPPASAQSTRAATTTSLSASPESPYDDQDVTLTATVSASETNGEAPLGMVEFLEGATPLGLAPLTNTDSSVKASISVRLSRGPHPLVARYLGDAAFDVSVSAPVHLIVNTR